ncbi:MAG TPA: type II toxin-antitoxin system VapC family toxin [Thermoanaerobaculia bacterium]|nr:type II toxin-antitoxin system VapC family toxin [Thermoanaerobaculia bacterium]
MIVVDASVLAPALTVDDSEGDRLRELLSCDELVAPEVIDLEVVSMLRRFARAGRLDARRSVQALADLGAFPLRRVPHLPLLGRVWELRDNVSAYDACYVALAEALGAALLTLDGRLTRAPGIRCEVQTVV